MLLAIDAYITCISLSTVTAMQNIIEQTTKNNIISFTGILNKFINYSFLSHYVL